MDLPGDEKISSSGTLRPGQLIVIAVVVITAVGLVYYIARQRGPDEAMPPIKGVTSVPEGSRAVSLYFAEVDKPNLMAETRLVAIGKEFVGQVGQVVRALLDGPEDNGVSTIAEGTRLLGAFYDNEARTVYLDFSSELVAGHPGGSSAEYFTIAAIIRTISENFPEVWAVQLLVEGLQVGTIAGHIDTYGPFPVSEWR